MKVVKLEDCINEIKSLDNNGFVTRSVNHICEDMRKEVKEFEAIPLDKVKQAKEEIKKKVYEYSGSGNEVTQAYCDGFKDSLAILDKLIESEGVNETQNIKYKAKYSV